MSSPIYRFAHAATPITGKQHKCDKCKKGQHEQCKGTIRGKWGLTEKCQCQHRRRK